MTPNSKHLTERSQVIMSINGTITQNSFITKSLGYWEKEKLKTLQRGVARSKQINVTIHRNFSELLPHWEKLKRKRLHEVQILLDSIA